jgi:Chitin binding Peritrophin-A domain
MRSIGALFVLIFIAGTSAQGVSKSTRPRTSVTNNWSGHALQICKQRALGVIEKDAKSCSKFHVCSEAGEIIMECPRGTFYNEAIKACDCGPNKKCNGKTYDQCPAVVKTDVCLKKESGALVSHPYNCNAFYQCSERSATLFTCPSGLLFNSETRSCDQPENTKCVRSTSRLCCGTRPSGCCPMPPVQSQCSPCIGMSVYPVVICCPPPPSCVPCVPPPCWPCNVQTTTAEGATTTMTVSDVTTTTTIIGTPPSTVIPTPAPTPGPPPPTVIPTPAAPNQPLPPHHPQPYPQPFPQYPPQSQMIFPPPMYGPMMPPPMMQFPQYGGMPFNQNWGGDFGWNGQW